MHFELYRGEERYNSREITPSEDAMNRIRAMQNKTQRRGAIALLVK